ncbi:MAG TPA: DUF2975 domain-containing protein [Spirillospora sp.]
MIIGLAMLTVGLTVLFPLLGLTGLVSPTDSREVDLGSRTEVAASAGEGMSLHGTRTAELTVDDPGFLDRVLLAAPEIVQGVLILVVLTLVMRITTTLRSEEDVFVPQNTRRLYGIAAVLLVTAFLVPALEVATTTALVNGTALESAVKIGYHLSGVLVLLGFIAAALAGAFAHGTRLRADTEGLV